MVRLLTGLQVGLVSQLIFLAACLCNSPVFRWVPFGAAWFHPVRAGPVVVVSCLGSSRVFWGLPGRLGRGGEGVGLFRGSVVWSSGRK